MRSTAIDLERPGNAITVCGPEQTNMLRRRIWYWPLDLDIHNQKLAALRENVRGRWGRYVRSLPMRGLASSDATRVSELLWTQLTEEIDQLSPPNASPTDEQGILMSWTRNGHHLEIEVSSDGTFEWFYRQRATDTTDGGAETGPDPPDTLLARLRQVVE